MGLSIKVNQKIAFFSSEIWKIWKMKYLRRRWVAMYIPVRHTHVRTSEFAPHPLSHAPQFWDDLTRTRTFFHKF